MLTLDNFETNISSAVSARGKSYFSSGKVISLEEKGNNTWIAEVEGSDIYSVEVTLETDGRINDYFCDCPSDDDICKHAAAVFFCIKRRSQ